MPSRYTLCDHIAGRYGDLSLSRLAARSQLLWTLALRTCMHFAASGDESKVSICDHARGATMEELGAPRTCEERLMIGVSVFTYRYVGTVTAME